MQTSVCWEGDLQDKSGPIIKPIDPPNPEATDSAKKLTWTSIFCILWEMIGPQNPSNHSACSLGLVNKSMPEDWASPKPPQDWPVILIHARIDILIDSPLSSSTFQYHSVNSLHIFCSRNRFYLAQSYSKLGPSSITIHHHPFSARSGPLGPHHCELLFGIEATIVLIALVAHLEVCCIAMENHRTWQWEILYGCLEWEIHCGGFSIASFDFGIFRVNGLLMGDVP